MTLTVALSSALTGLQTAQRGLDTVSNNIANVNTVGYTRKIFNQDSIYLNGIGAGVTTGAITRRIDEGILEDLRSETSSYGQFDAEYQFLRRVQDLFGTSVDNSSFAHSINNVAEEFERLALEPDQPSLQLQAVQSAQEMTRRISLMSETIQGLRLDADREIQSIAAEINQILSSVSTLNDQITLADAVTNSSGDLEDKRDQNLTRLAELIDVEYFVRDNGAVSIYTRDGTTLLDSEAVTVSHSALSVIDAQFTYEGGNFNGIFAGMLDITETIRDGRLRGLIDMRDQTLPDLQAQLDELAQSLKDITNLVANRGTSYPEIVTAMEGSRTFIGSGEVGTAITDADFGNLTFNTGGTITATDPTAFSTLSVGDRIRIDGSTGDDGIYTVLSVAGTVINVSPAPATGNTDNAGSGVTITPVGDVQSMSIEDGDVTIMLYDADGNEAFSTKLVADLGFSSGIIYDEADHPSTDTLAGAIQTWVRAQDTSLSNATVTLNEDNRLEIDLNTSAYGLAFRDEAGAGRGSAQEDVTIGFDSDSDGTTDSTHTGFSNFFGFRDVFKTDDVTAVWDSKYLPANFRAGVGTTVNLQFSDESNGTAFLNTALSIPANATLDDIAEAINSSSELQGIMSATVIPEAGGARLRITHEQGEQFYVTQVGGTSLIDVLGLKQSNVSNSRTLGVREDIVLDPSSISRGSMQYNSDTGRYFLSGGDNTIAAQLGDIFTNNVNLDAAGGLPNSNISFVEYAATMISRTSSQTNTVEQNHEYQAQLTQALNLKHAEISGVNLDEEMAQLMVFEQAYTAAARVISTTKQMFDILSGIV